MWTSADQCNIIGLTNRCNMNGAKVNAKLGLLRYTQFSIISELVKAGMNLLFPFCPITGQLTDLLELSDLPLLPLHPQPVQEASPAPILAMEKTVTDSVAALQKCDEV